jgi:alpha-ketoglutarate-dependent taurine dioxygenase
MELPAQIIGEMAWLGPEISTQTDRWVMQLSQVEVAELIAAAQAYLAKDQGIADINATSFSLPTFAAKLKTLRTELINGHGFALVKGLPVTGMSREQAACMFCGIGAHLGRARSQNAKGHILGHVRDIGADPNDANARIYQTHARQTFHTDSCDVVALLCLHTAKEGGDSLLVSAESIYNRMRELRADLVELLMQPIATDRRGEVPEGADPWFEIPVFSWHMGKLSLMYQRQYINSAQRFPQAPRLTAEHVEALDMFDALANDPALHFSMRLEQGDMQFVYNHALLHDRTGFTDHLAQEKKRHLLRLWLSIPGDRELPASFAQRYGSITVGDRGGIVVADMRLNAPIDPV